MNREVSLYLDIVRFAAAMMVMIGHVSGMRLTAGLFWQAGPYGPEAVAIFFVLSGFVIGYVTDTREGSATDYAIARAARIYSVALPALAISFVLDAIGMAARPELYTAAWGYRANGQLLQAITGALFINQLWFLDIVPGSDLPYWSLGYEVPYYVIFGIAAFAPLRWRVAGVVTALLVAGPQVASLFPLWLAGLGAYHLCARRPVGQVPSIVLCIGGLAGWIGYEAWAWHGHRLDAIELDGLMRPDILQDYVVGLLFAAHIVGFRGVSTVFAPLLARIAGPVRWLAGATFSIYLFHLPVAQFLASEVPWPPTATSTRVTLFGGTLVLVFALAELTERRKEMWRRTITILLRRVMPRAPA